MLTRSIKFEDYNGVEREEDHYFNLNRSEVLKWLTTTGDYTLDKVLERLSQERNGKKIMEYFEELIKMSYGRKSLDGRKFEKSDEIWNDFYQTEAYSALFTELVTDANKAVVFIQGIIPKELSKDIEKLMRENPDTLPPEIRGNVISMEKK